MRKYFTKNTVSFLVSGKGLIFKAVADNIKNGKINAKLGILISDKSNSRALDTAKKFGMKSFFLDPSQHRGVQLYEKKMMNLIKGCKTDLIVAAGYMRILSPFFVKSYKNRIINIHPSLLPSFAGKNGQKLAIDYGVKVTGCTAHFIDCGMDTGPIIMQSAIPVHEDDTIESLSMNILKREFSVLSESVRLFCEGKINVIGRTVYIKNK